MTVNLFAGMGSHQSAKSETDVWFSPPAVLEAVGGAESFDLDPCTHAQRPWSTAKNHYTIQDNGLILPWFGRVWLNPPYTIEVITKFLGRMAAHNHGTALIFARTETDPFFRFVWGSASAVLFLRGRLNFHRLDGLRADKNGGAPSVLIAYGEEDCDILAAAPIDGHFVPLRLAKSIVVPFLRPTWRRVVDECFAHHDGPIALQDLYRALENHPNTKRNPHWREKIRQTLQRGQYEIVKKGVWQRRDVVPQKNLHEAA